jgi:hypothetical protein
MSKSEPARPIGRFTEHRIIRVAEVGSPSQGVAATRSEKKSQLDDPADVRDGVAVGDKIVVLFSDDQGRISLRLTEGVHDLEKGLLSSASALGMAIKGADEGDEIEFEHDDGRQRKALIESVDKGLIADAIPAAWQKESLTKAVPGRFESGGFPRAYR